MKRKYVRLDPELVLAMREDGVMIKDIAEFFGSHPSSINYALKRAKNQTGHPRRQMATEVEPEEEEAPLPPRPSRTGRITPGAEYLSRSGGFYKGPPPGEVIRLAPGVKKMPKGGVSEAYSLTRRLAQTLDGIWRNGARQDVKIAAKKCYALASEIEDTMTRAVREDYTDHQGGARSFG